ncbi:hypothetical protein NWK44_004723 [Salmonella enterica]|nr:hypothetical protein [Salmonella enterica]
MIIDKIQYCDYDYILKQNSIGKYFVLIIYKAKSDQKVCRGTEPKNLVRKKTKVLLEKKIYAGKNKEKIEAFVDEMKDCLTYVVFNEIKEKLEIANNQKEGEK